jgi:hypothetical protein
MTTNTKTAEPIELVTCPCCGDASPLDEEIRALVHVLNAHGMRTRSSCCGHRGRSRESEAYVAFWATADALLAFCSALRRIESDRLDFLLEVRWITSDPPDEANLIPVRFSILDSRGRAPKSPDLAALAEQMEAALGEGTCADCMERAAA